MLSTGPATARVRGKVVRFRKSQLADERKRYRRVDKPKNVQTARLERSTFRISRDLEFFTRKELEAQTGHSRSDWPLAIVKELVDNALDACEGHGIATVIAVSLDPCGISVQDNGPGLPEDTLQGALDFAIRTSSNEAYVSPTRGAQGQALKTLIAMPYVLDESDGAFIVTARGARHSVKCRVDAISQSPVIDVDRRQVSDTVGTCIRVEWGPRGNESWPFVDPRGGGLGVYGWLDDIRHLLDAFAIFNPHATFTLDVPCEKTHRWEATDLEWLKWRPDHPTSPHWYERDSLQRIIAAYITDDRAHGTDRTVRAFLTEFEGLARSARCSDVLHDTGLHNRSLSALIVGEGLDAKMIDRLLASMKKHSRPVRAQRLGIIGEDHFRRRFEECGCVEGSFEYRKRVHFGSDGLPCVVEVGFAARDGKEESRLIHAGINWSAAIKNPFPQLDDLLGSNWAGSEEPVLIAAHIAHPRVSFTDRGKSTVVCAATDDVRDLMRSALKPWAKMRRAEIRGKRSQANRESYCAKKKSKQSEIADKLIPPAYYKASGDNSLPASQRQIFYCCRAEFEKLTGRPLGQDYFRGKLLRKYVNTHPEETENWKITADPRGTLFLPHCDDAIPVGTLAIDEYLDNFIHSTTLPTDMTQRLNAEWPRRSPRERFQAVLYVEKEGFNPLLEAAQIAARFNVAILSCKGQSVVASRRFVDHVCHQHGVPLVIVHDFDKSGFEISQRLVAVSERDRQQGTVAYEFQNKIQAADLGLRLDDVERYHLEHEAFTFDGGFAADSLCTEAEREFLMSNRRVELNAFTSPQFIEWLESKLNEAGIREGWIPPADDVLAEAFRRAYVVARQQQAIEAITAQAIDDARRLNTRGLRAKLARMVNADPATAWDSHILTLAQGEL